MSCHEVSACLTLLGLVAELGAIVSILWTVGLGDWVRRLPSRVRGVLSRTWGRLRKKKEQKTGAAHISGCGGGGAKSGGSLTLTTGTPPPIPKTFEEVDKRLKELAAANAAALDRHDREMREHVKQVKSELRGEILAAESESARRHVEIDERIEEQTRARFAERKLEGIIFAVGVLLQAAGAVLLIVC